MCAYLCTMQQVILNFNEGIESYEALVEWIHTFESVSTFDALKIIARNKTDLQEES